MRRSFVVGLLILLAPLARPPVETAQRQRRESPPQRKVERTIEYFVGKWRFDYIGGEFPPLSPGSRSGTAAFSRIGAANFVTGQIDGELAGKPYRETQTIGFDPGSNALVAVERRADGSELVSLGSWQSPLAITWQTAPLVSNGKTYQLRRMISVTSDVAFEVTEEFSIDAGAFKRLGNGHYTRAIE
jgi:hypothetical protein